MTGVETVVISRSVVAAEPSTLRTSTLEESRTGTASDSPETAAACCASAEPSSGPPSSSTRSSSQSDHVPDCL
ncbi:Uncharacterised protein [Mycobacteroides abscessus subsp. abscessus]|nr:Uncharacterised protein [Mycobacteroides abscessus subsp. abscessus]